MGGCTAILTKYVNHHENVFFAGGGNRKCVLAAENINSNQISSIAGGDMTQKGFLSREFLEGIAVWATVDIEFNIPSHERPVIKR